MPIIPASAKWVGPPVLKLCLRSGLTLELDGRKRLAEARERGLPDPPVYVVTNHLDAIKALIHAGHHDRAAEHAMTYAPEYVTRATSSLSSVMGIARQRLIPYVNAFRLPSERHKLPRRAIGVVNRARALERRMREDGRPATLNDLIKVLGDFGEDE